MNNGPPPVEAILRNPFQGGQSHWCWAFLKRFLGESLVSSGMLSSTRHPLVDTLNRYYMSGLYTWSEIEPWALTKGISEWSFTGCGHESSNVSACGWVTKAAGPGQTPQHPWHSRAHWGAFDNVSRMNQKQSTEFWPRDTWKGRAKA